MKSRRVPKGLPVALAAVTFSAAQNHRESVVARRVKRARVASRRFAFVVIAILLVCAALSLGLRARREAMAARGLIDGRAALERGNWQDACKFLGRYLSRHPDDIGVLKDYARAQLRIRPLELANVGAAIRALRQVHRHDPRDPTAFGQLVTLYYDLGNASEVIYISRNRLEHSPGDRRAMVWLAKGFLSQEKAQEAREILLKLVQELEEQEARQPEYLEACWLLAAQDGQSQDAKTRNEAVTWLDRAVEYDPNSAEALVNRARFRRSVVPAQGWNRDEVLAVCRQDLDRARSFNPANPRLRLLLCEEWTACGDFAKAAAELKALDDIRREDLEQYSPYPEDWAAAKFVVAANLTLRRGTASEGVALADGALEGLTLKRQRRAALPSAIELYVQGGKVAEARKCLDEYVDALLMTGAIPAPNEKVSYLKAVVLLAEGRFYQAIDVLEPACRRKPTLSILWKLVAEAYSQTGQTRRAISAIKQYLRLEPLDRQMTMQLAREYIAQRDYGRAIASARLAESLDPTDIAVRLLRIGASIAIVGRVQGKASTQPQLERLIQELADLRRSHPDRVEVRILQSVLAYNLGRVDQAEGELKRAIDECSEPLNAELQLARLYFNSARPADAVKVLREAQRRHPKSAAPWEVLSQIQYALGQYEETRRTLEAAVKGVPDVRKRRDLETGLAMLEIVHLDRQAGIDRLGKLTGTDSHGLRARSSLLALPEVRRDPDTAQRLIDEIRSIQGQTGLLWRYHQAAVWFSRNDWQDERDDIIEHLERCLDGDPGWPGAALLLGRVLEAINSRERAEAVYRRLLAANPSATEVMARLVLLLEAGGRFADAKDILVNLSLASGGPASGTDPSGALTSDLSRVIEELKLRLDAATRSVDTYILLSRLIYRQSKNVDVALEYLDRAEAMAPGSMTVLAARVSILQDAHRTTEARTLLDRLARDKNSFEVNLLRASFLAEAGEKALAEEAYRRLADLAKDGQGHSLLGDFYLNANRLDDAIVVWESGLKAHPAGTGLKRRLVKGLLKRARPNDADRAAALLTELEAELPRDPDLMAVRAFILLKEGGQDAVRRARELLERVVKLRPTDVDSYLRLIQMAMSSGDYAEARDLAMRAQGASATNTDLIVARGRAEFGLRNLGMAWELANAALAEAPNNVAAYGLLTSVATESRDPKLLAEALASVSKGIKGGQGEDRLQRLSALLLEAMGKPGEAIKRLEAYTHTERGERSVQALLALADLYQMGGDLAKSGQCIERAETIAPRSSAVRRKRIAWLGAKKEFGKIIQWMAAREEQEPNDVPVMMEAASVLASSESREHRLAAASLFEQITTIQPKMIEARLALGAVAYGMGDVDRAERIVRQAQELAPDDPRVLNDLAWVLGEGRGKYEAALELVNKGVRLAPQNRNLRDTRGVIYMGLPGHLRDARADFEKCLELTRPKSRLRARSLYRLALACAALKDNASAKRHLDEAVAIDPEKDVLTPEERAEIRKISEVLARPKSPSPS